MSMLASAFGHRIISMQLHVPHFGCWWYEALFDDDAPEVLPSASIVTTFGDLTLTGTVDPQECGVYAGQRKARVAGGAGGWAKRLAPKSYANDAGVKALQVAQDVAADAGETLGDTAAIGRNALVGKYFMRRAVPAAGSLETALATCGSASARLHWWVDFAGLTQVAAARPSRPVPAQDSYHVHSYDPQERLMQLSADDTGTLIPGDTVTLPEGSGTVVLRDLTYYLTPEALRVTAWCGTPDALAPSDSRGRLAGVLQAIAVRSVDAERFGLRRYRVVSMHPDGRVNLQIVTHSDYLPSSVRVRQAPGCPGAHGELADGSEVLVSFVDGDPGDPVVVNFAGRGDGHVPEMLVLASADNSAPLAARQNDTVNVLLPPMVFSGLIGGAPATGVLSSVMSSTLGVISTGSAKVRIG